MTTKKTAIVFVPRPNFGQLDAYIPIASEIAIGNTEGLVHYTIVADKQAAKALNFSAFHYEIMSKAGPIHDLTKIHFFDPTFSKLAKGICLLVSIIKIWLVHSRVITIYSHHKKSIADKIIHGVLSAFSEVIAFPSIMGHVNEGLFYRKTPALYQKAFLIDTGRQVKKRLQFRRKCYFFSHEKQYLQKLHPDTSYKLIGHPRLLSSWPENKNRFGESYMKNEFIRVKLNPKTQGVAVIICTNPEYFWVGATDSYFQMLKDTIFLIKKYQPNKIIFLSLKDKYYVMHKNLLDEIIKGIENVFVSDVANAVLSIRADLCVSLFESSAIFEYVYSNVKCIEYSKFSPEWAEIYGSQSIWISEPTISFANTKSDLDSHLADHFKSKVNKKEINTRQQMLNFYQQGKFTDLEKFVRG